MLSLVLGSATHSFELMLSPFILGLALGSLWIRRRADRLTNPVTALGIVQWIMGLLAIGTLLVISGIVNGCSAVETATTRALNPHPVHRCSASLNCPCTSADAGDS